MKKRIYNTLSAIVCVDRNWGIGYKNELLYKISEDLKHFKDTTINKSVIMGRKTFESIGSPLENRTNFVVSRSQNLNTDDLNKGNIHIGNFEIEKVMPIYRASENELIVIGGQSLYEKYIDLFDFIYLTMVFDEREADSFFPNVDEMKEYSATSITIPHFENNNIYKFIIYKRNNKSESQYKLYLKGEE